MADAWDDSDSSTSEEEDVVSGSDSEDEEDEKEKSKKEEPKKHKLEMYNKYNGVLKTLPKLEEYFGDDPTKPLRIDLLEPKNQIEFDEYSNHVRKMIEKFKEHEHFDKFLEDVIFRLYKDMKKQDIQSLQKNLKEMLSTPVEQKTGRRVNIMGSKSKGGTGDLFEQAEHENEIEKDEEEEDF